MAQEYAGAIRPEGYGRTITRLEAFMNSDILKGKWKQLKGSIKDKWGDLTDDEIDRIDGNFDKFEGTLQERYGWKKEEANQTLNDWLAPHKAP